MPEERSTGVRLTTLDQPLFADAGALTGRCPRTTVRA